jgi:hypothetical protein
MAYKQVPDEPVGSDDLAASNETNLDPFAEELLSKLTDEQLVEFVQARDELFEQIQQKHPLKSRREQIELMATSMAPLIAQYLG